LLLLLLPAAPATACPSGYESTERLVKRADHILEVEVLEVSNEPIPDPPPPTLFGSPVDEEEYENARARVRVTRELRGHFPVRELTLVGGPYHSCAPTPCLLHFEVGERLTLILEGPLPKTIETLAIHWRCRCTSRTLEEVQAILDRVWTAWRRRMDHLDWIAPEAVAAAKRASLEPDVLRALPFPALAVLAEHLREPGRAAPTADAAADSAHVGAGPGRASRLPTVVDEELARRIETTPEEVAAFQREVLRTWLVAGLQVPEPLARRFVRAVEPRELVRTDLPLGGLEIEDEEDRALLSVQSLLRLAHDEPDALVWSMADPKPGDLDPAVFAPWLERHADELPRDWTHLEILLALPCPQAASYVYRAWAAEANPARYDEYLAFFEALGDERTAKQVRERQAEAEARERK